MLAPGFWDDQRKAQEVINELNGLKDQVQTFTSLEKAYEDLELAYELVKEEEDKELKEELEADLKQLKTKLNEFELQLLLSGPYDKNNAILELHPGAGGTESQDWGAMLLRMYTRWAEKKGFKVETLDYLPGDEAGIKSVTLLIKGRNAYGYLKAESPEELKIDTYRSSGAGGQHVNTTDSAVRITHLPTGIVVTCQSERSQIQNREKALNMLKGKLYQRKLEEQERQLNELRGEQKEIGWGNQIRSYVFHPYSLVKDHRTNVETGNIQSVMDGEIDLFIDAYLRSQLG